MKLKRMLALILVLGILFCFAACNKPQEQGDTPTTTEGTEEIPVVGEGKNLITVKVVHKDKTEKTFKFRTDKEFLGDVLLEHKLIQGSDGAFGLEVSHVDGEQAIYNTDKAYWALYEGEEYATTSAAGIVLTDGGVYKLVYETF